MTAQNINDIMFQLFMADLRMEDGKKILDILRFKGVFPPAGREEDMGLINFLENFWDWDKSPYIKERLLQEHGIHRRYVYRCNCAIRRYWLPWFGREIGLKDISRQQIQDFILSFIDNPSLRSASGRNDVIKTGTIALRWAYARGLIVQDITQGLSLFGCKPAETVILTRQVARDLFSRPWKHKKAMLANKVAMLTGLRSGEIQALRKCDIGRDCIYVRHSWNKIDGLKLPKNGGQRKVFVPFADFLNELRELTPGEEDFLFHHRSLRQPMDTKCWLRELRQELLALGMDQEFVRGIRFHSWRHYYTTYMRSCGQLEPHLLQRLTGHKSAAMMQHYGNHSLMEEADLMKAAASKVFGEMMETMR